MPELSEEEIELLEEMDRRIKKEKPQPTKERDVDVMLGEYYEEHPEKKSYLQKLKERKQERKEMRAEEKEIYEESYKTSKEKAIRKRAKRKAREKYERTLVEKIAKSMDKLPQQTRKPSQQKKQQYYIRGGKAYPIAGKKKQQPQKRQQYRPKTPQYDIDLGSGLGSLVTGGGRQPQIKMLNIKFDSGIAGFGTPSGKGKKKKMKQIDPFEKLF